jgi:hypothetical protein
VGGNKREGDLIKMFHPPFNFLPSREENIGRNSFADARIKNRCRYLLGYEKRRAFSFAKLKTIQFKRNVLPQHRAG